MLKIGTVSLYPKSLAVLELGVQAHGQTQPCKKKKRHARLTWEPLLLQHLGAHSSAVAKNRVYGILNIIEYDLNLPVDSPTGNTKLSQTPSYQFDSISAFAFGIDVVTRRQGTFGCRHRVAENHKDLTSMGSNLSLPRLDGFVSSYGRCTISAMEKRMMNIDKP